MAGTLSKDIISPFFSLTNNPVKFRLFLFSKLPAAYFSGIRIQHANEESCAASVPYAWFTKNPFRSTYFACLGMAAEMSTGVLAMAHIYKRVPAVSMLIIGSEARFFKKAKVKTVFTCSEGLRIKDTVLRAIEKGTSQTITVASIGTNEEGEIVAEFSFTWSFKTK